MNIDIVKTNFKEINISYDADEIHYNVIFDYYNTTTKDLLNNNEKIEFQNVKYGIYNIINKYKIKYNEFNILNINEKHINLQTLYNKNISNEIKTLLNFCLNKEFNIINPFNRLLYIPVLNEYLFASDNLSLLVNYHTNDYKCIINELSTNHLNNYLKTKIKNTNIVVCNK